MKQRLTIGIVVLSIVVGVWGFLYGLSQRLEPEPLAGQVYPETTSPAQPTPEPLSNGLRYDLLVQEVAPLAGTTLAVEWGDMGQRLVEVGAIDLDKFEARYGGLDAEQQTVLLGQSSRSARRSWCEPGAPSRDWPARERSSRRPRRPSPRRTRSGGPPAPPRRRRPRSCARRARRRSRRRRAGSRRPCRARSAGSPRPSASSGRRAIRAARGCRWARASGSRGLRVAAGPSGGAV